MSLRKILSYGVVAALVIAAGVHQGTASGSTPTGPTFIPPGYIDYQVNGKHHRHDFTSFSLPSTYYKRQGDIEEFGLRTKASNRMEHDTNVHYKTGKREFEGDLQVFSGISQQSVVQIFGGGKGGPILMIKVYGRKNGSLVLTRNSADNMITNAFSAGKIRVRLVHDLGAHQMSVYINGARKWSGADAGTSYKGGYNVKYGLYGTFKAPTRTIWSDVRITGS